MFKTYLRPPVLSSRASIGLLILRLTVGGLMLTHGFPKLEKIIAGDMTFGDPLLLGEATSLVLTVFAEFVCSLFLIFGFLTRPALFFLAFTMAVAAFIVHGGDGIGKQESALHYLGGYLCLLFTGPGHYSLDEKLFR